MAPGYTRNLGFGGREIGFNGQVEQQDFSSFFANFFLAIFDDFSKWSSPKTLKNFEKSSNMPKKNWQKMKKNFVMEIYR